MRAGGSAEELERAVLAATLDARPGTRQRYSNAASVALGMIVRVVSGQPLHEYLEGEVFAPLGMSATGFDPGAFVGRTVLRVPTFPELGMSPTMEAFLPLRLAAAGLFSTADDLLRFGRLFLRDRQPRHVLASATRCAMLSPQTAGIPSMGRPTAGQADPSFSCPGGGTLWWP